MPNPTTSELQAFVAATEAALEGLLHAMFEEPDDFALSNRTGPPQPHQVHLGRIQDTLHDENETPRFKLDGLKLFVSPADDDD